VIRVAHIGFRGVPANYGGAETAVEELGSRLAAEGVEVVVYCRVHKSPFPDRMYRGMRRVVLPSVDTFQLDTITHSILSTLHVRLRNTADVIEYHGMGNALCLPLLAFSRKRAIVGIDGPDWERPKWGPVARRVLKFSARIAVRMADHLIIDNHPSIDYFKRHFGLTDDDYTYIAYGADMNPPTETNYVESLGLEPRGYVLYVGALVPDKGADILIEGYRQVPGNVPLVVVGDSPYAPEFRKQVHDAAAEDPRIRMLGYVYGEDYRQLVANAYVYVHPPRQEGTSPALLQAMGYGACVVVNSLPEALVVAGDAALPFALHDPDDLARKIEQVLADPELAESFREKARERVRAEYSWDAVTEAHRSLYERLLNGTPSK
jgi:glycosyltransferase involved in cell wall biosynthesis